MPPKIDITGHKYGKLTVIKEVIHNGKKAWKCSCECGGTAFPSTNNLRMGISKSCGCTRSVQTIERNKQGTIHGMTKFPALKQLFSAMHKRYQVSSTWGRTVQGGLNFVNWVTANGWEQSNKYEVIPIDIDKPLGPQNCILKLWTPDLTGRVFNKLVVLHKSSKKSNVTLWVCICDCGSITEAGTRQLITGGKKSCGCLVKDTLVKRNKDMATHGLRNHPLYRIWRGIRNRCKDKDNKYYGSKNIQMCAEWDTNVVTFFTWMITNGWQLGMALHRKDSDGDYTPDNCKLMTRSEHTIYHNNLRYKRAGWNT